MESAAPHPELVLGRTRAHPSLYDCSEDHLRSSIQVPDSAEAQMLGPGVFTMPSPFSSSFAEMLHEEVVHYQRESDRLGVARSPPSVFVHKGALLGEMGLGPVVSALVGGLLSPLVQELFPTTGGLRGDDWLASVLFFETPIAPTQDLPSSASASASGVQAHCDDSCVTLDVCLSTCSFSGGELVFQLPEKDGTTELTVRQRPGQATLFAGHLPHFARPLVSGNRASLVIWCVSKHRSVAPGIYDAYSKYLSHIGLRESAGRRSLAFDVPAEYLRAGRCHRPPARLLGRLQRQRGLGFRRARARVQASAAPCSMAAALQRRDICESVLNQLGESQASPALPRVCRRWREHFSTAALRSAHRLQSSPGVKEVVTMQVGGCGTSLGLALWELLCLEHGLDSGGHLHAEPAEGMGSFFGEMRDGRWRPRSIFADVRSEHLHGLFAQEIPSQHGIFSPWECCSGRSTLDSPSCQSECRAVAEDVLEAVRRHAEGCDSSPDFLLLHHLGGAAGSGLTNSVLQLLSMDYKKARALTTSVFPDAAKAPLSLSPYHALMAAHGLIEHDAVAATVVLEEAKLRGLASRSPEVPTFSTEQTGAAMVAQVLSSMTTGIRLGSPLHADFAEIESNHVPYRSLHFLQAAYAPLLRDPTRTTSHRVAEITMETFTSASLLCDNDLLDSKYMACTLMYRGSVAPKDVMAAVATIKSQRTLSFVDWCPCGFKCGISYHPPLAVPSLPEQKALAVLNLSNNTGMGKCFERLAKSFDDCHETRRYTDKFAATGVEEDDLLEARENLAALERDYLEAGAADVTDGGPDGDEF